MKRSSLRQPVFLVITLLLLLGAASMRTALSALEIHLRKLPIYAPENRQLRSLPAETEEWLRRGNDQVLSPEVVDELGTSNYIDRSYVRPANPDADSGSRQRAVALSVHLAYYTGMIDAVPHVPERCFVGGGLHVAGGPWPKPLPLKPRRLLKNYYGDGDDFLRVPSSFNPQGRDTVRIPKFPGEDDFPSMRVTEFEDPRRPGQPLYSGYLFLANGKFVTHAEQVRLAAFDLTDDYAYYLKIQFTGGAGEFESPDEFAAASADLLSELLPGILLCVPDWGAVQAGTYPPDNPRGVKEQE